MNKKNKSRRSFIKSSLSTAAIISIGMKGFSSILSNNQSAESQKTAMLKSDFDQQPLPYSYEALEDVIDRKTMEIHYTKHAAGYSKNLNEAAIAEKVEEDSGIESLLSNISKYSIKLRNNAGGHYNHEMFWQCMRPKREQNLPNGALLKKIEDTFGSFNNFQTEFAEAAKNRFGSGWAWLYQTKEGNLRIGSTANQDNPLMDIATIEHKGQPMLCIDVWEHAYYLTYQNKRADYINNWWKVVNWDYVSKRLHL